jgi:hypothetical protein
MTFVQYSWSSAKLSYSTLTSTASEDAVYQNRPINISAVTCDKSYDKMELVLTRALKGGTQRATFSGWISNMS